MSTRLPNTAHTSRTWRIHELTQDFRLEDVWALPTPGGADDFHRLVRLIASGDPSRGSNRSVRLLWAIRWKVGELLGWDSADASSGAPTLRGRLPADLRAAPPGPDFAALPFTSLYLLDDEWAAEIANRTMRGVMHVGWVPDGTGGYRGQMAVYVKPNGLLGSGYMAAIRRSGTCSCTHRSRGRSVERGGRASADHRRCFRFRESGHAKDMSARNVLLLALDPVPADQVRTAIAERNEYEDVNVHVVAPATHVGRFQWLTGATDEARADAAELADQTAEAVEAEVETEVGERDPLLAVEDALAFFAADEILVAGTADVKTEAGLRRVELPISTVGGRRVEGEAATGVETYARDVAGGKREETPFVIIGTVAATLLALIALISLIAFVAVWLA